MRNILLLLTCFALICPGILPPADATAAEKKVIIGFRQAPGAAEDSAIVARKGKIKRKFKNLKAVTASLPEEEIAKLKNNPQVAYVQEDVRIQLIDPLPAALEYQTSWGVERIGSRAVHQQGNTGTTAGGTRVKIAIVDSGIDSSHPELAGVFAGGIDLVCFFDENGQVVCPNDPVPDDENGHGTHLAGIIAAALNDSAVVGVAPSVEIYAAKAFDRTGFADISAVLQGIDWAIDQNVDIINLSLATIDLPALQEACDRAWESGILVISAAGNDFGGPVSYPAAYDSVIAVSATLIDDQVAGFSNVGAEIELAAPGQDIPSTHLNGQVLVLQGTSQAAPHVSGAAALVIASGIEDLNGNGRINDEVRTRLQQTATDLGVQGRDSLYGFGLVNAANAVSFQGIPPTDPGPFEPLAIDLSRTAAPRENDAQQVILPGGSYLFTIKHSTLNRLFVEVYENGQRVPELSRVVQLRGKKAKNNRVFFNAPNGPYDIWLTPDGRVGSGARMFIDSYEPPPVPASLSQAVADKSPTLKRALKVYR